MLAGVGPDMGTRSAGGRAGNGVSTIPAGPPAASETHGRFDDREYHAEMVYSGSDQDSDSGDDEDAVAAGGDRRGVKRERSEREVGNQAAPTPGGLSAAYSGVPGAKPGKKTRGRVKIKMEFIDNKLRRYTTFSKRKTGIMKKVSGGDPRIAEEHLQNSQRARTTDVRPFSKLPRHRGWH